MKGELIKTIRIDYDLKDFPTTKELVDFISKKLGEALAEFPLHRTNNERLHVETMEVKEDYSTIFLWSHPISGQYSVRFKPPPHMESGIISLSTDST